MFSTKSSLKPKNVHFASSPAGRRECYPIGLGELRPRQFALQQIDQRRGGKAVGKSVTRGGRLARGERIELLQRFAEKPRRGMRLLDAQPQVRVGDQDASPQQDPLAAALRRRR